MSKSIGPANPNGFVKCFRAAFAPLLGVSLVLSLALLSFEWRLDQRIVGIVHTNEFPWTRLERDSVSKVLERTASDLRAGCPPQRLDKVNRSRLEMAISSWRGARKANTWPNAMLGWGVVEGLSAFPSDSRRNLVDQFLERIVDPRGDLRQRPRLVEEVMVGGSLLEVALRKNETRYLSAAREIMNSALRDLPRTSTGTLAYNPSSPDHALVDTLGMVCPFLVRAGVEFKDNDAIDLAVKSLKEFLDYGMDRASGLPWHAYRLSDHEGYGILGWTRGVGWLLVGLAGSLEHLPKTHAGYFPLEEAFVRLVACVAKKQDATGLWPWALSQGGSLDSSGSAMIGWAILQGIRKENIGKEYQEVVEKAAAAIISVTDREGRVQQALGECQSVGHYPKLFGYYPWGQGAACAFLASLSKNRI